MNLTNLKSNILQLLDKRSAYFSIFIHTEEGDIAINANEPRKAASLIKIPILIESFHQIENHRLQPNTLVYIEDDMKVSGAGVIYYLTQSNIYSYQNLLELMITFSDNTAANIMLDKIGMNSINKRAKSLACTHTKMERFFMDQQSQKNGYENYTTAHDMVRFLSIITKSNSVINENSRNEILKILSNQQFNHKLPGYWKNDSKIQIYHKTGELPGVEHDAAIMTYKDRTIIAAILSEDSLNNSDNRNYIAEIGKQLANYIEDDQYETISRGREHD
ncbi:serine hydrolase [Virgibacillus byunsanensis]|uniref:Serine hydrolase n=1 Tax=Virgibacillus byunsanensis TaxID=570945 RepID=A0ABW3LF83_9BACI